MFIGRKLELGLLDKAYKSGKSELVVIYGRRRIGKSSLVNKFSEKKSEVYFFEAIEGVTTKGQIRHFTDQLKKQVGDPILNNVIFQDWENVFSYLTEKIISKKRKKKKVLFFDELQWMAASRSRMISLLKFYWDNHWKKNNIMLILCGSVASFMVNKVLHSKALYGRTTVEILLKGLAPDETFFLFRKKRSREEVLKYLLVFGGVPKYLEQIDLNRSFNQNINDLCFSRHGLMTTEIERVFFSQFREARIYMRIVSLLNKAIYSFQEISKKVGVSSGGGLGQYIKNLEQAEIIKSFVPFKRGLRSKFKKYTLSDEYLLFYFNYINPNQRIISESTSKKLFETLTKDSFDIWLGFAFERFCIKNAGFLAGIMGFEEEVILASPYFEKNDKGFQIDLMYDRSDDVLTVCEIKHYNKKIGTKIIPEMERKCSLLKVPKGHTLEKALVSLHGPDQPLRDSEYFNHFVTLDDIFK